MGAYYLRHLSYRSVRYDGEKEYQNQGDKHGNYPIGALYLHCSLVHSLTTGT